MRKLLALGLPLILLAVPALAETFPLDIEFGYRWSSIDGNEDVYRSQINEDDGFLIRNLTFFGNKPTSDGEAADTFRIIASDLGTGPSSLLRIEAGRTEAYKLRVNYQRMEAYNALPAFANPLLSQGIVPGQHTLDRTRTIIDSELELLPGRAISMAVGYTRNEYEGPGATTYFVGQDEFRLTQDVDDSDEEIRASMLFNSARFWGSITQGWRSFEGAESLTLVPGAGNGNNSGTILGTPISATGIALESENSVQTPFTNVFLSGMLFDRLKLTGTWVSSSSSSDSESAEQTAGSFVGFDISRFFSGLSESVSSDVESDLSRGGVRAEWMLTDGIDLLAGYRSEEREIEGTALVQTLFLNTVSFGGVNLGNLQQVIDAGNGIEREEEIADIGVQFRSLGPVSLRATYSETNQEIFATPDVSEIVIDEPYGGQGGEFERKIKTFDIGASMVLSGFTLSAQYRDDSADDPIFRTDYLDRQKQRIRAAYATKGGFFRGSVLVENTEAENLDGGVGYEGEMDTYAADFELAPWPMLRFRASYAQHDAASVVLFRRPETLVIDESLEVEEGEAAELGMTLLFKPLTIDLGYGTFDNEGSIPLEMNRLRGRVKLHVKGGAGIAAEYAYDEYDETTANIADYTAARYGLYFTWTQ